MTHRFDPTSLREYDIRGIVGEALGTDDARAIGRGFATLLRRAGGTRVAVGRDGRVSSVELEAALIEGLTASGCDVVRVGLGPTPMLYYAEATLEVDGGIQITGSHNPGNYNGFKMVFQHRPFFGEDIQTLGRMAAEGDWDDGTGTVTDYDIMDAYVGRLVAGYAGGAYRVGWDMGNGAAGPVVEKLVKLLPGEHHLLFTEVDGNFSKGVCVSVLDSGRSEVARGVVNYSSADIGLIKGVDRATTTTMSALRTAVIVAQALTNQKLVLDQITALNTTTSTMIQRTSEMLKDNSAAIQEQAASSTIGIEQLQAAFANIYATMDSIDEFKLKALDNMSTTIGVLESEVQKSKAYIDRVQQHDARNAAGTLDIG